MKKVLIVAAILLGVVIASGQNQPGVSFVTVTTAAGCPTPVLSVTGTVWQLCGAPDGVYASTVNFPTPIKLGVSSTATGVTSVNGKTGAVILGATTTIQ